MDNYPVQQNIALDSLISREHDLGTIAEDNPLLETLFPIITNF